MAKDDEVVVLLRELIAAVKALPGEMLAAQEAAAGKAKAAKARAEKPEGYPDVDLSGKVDSIPMGQVHTVPILRQPSAELAAEIRAGKYDAIVSELLTLEDCHQKRELVMEACKARGGKLARAAAPPRERKQPEPVRLR